MLISVIVPTFNDAVHLPMTVRPLADHPDVEMIVVDGGSTDLTVEIAKRFTPFVFVGAAHRADQMNLGARHATGDILLFLRAGSFLLAGAIEEIQRRVIRDGAIGGAFDLNVDSERRLCRLMARVSSHRARALKLPHADQGIFVWRQVFEVLGGFPRIPIMEDVAFASRLRRAGRLTFIRWGLVNTEFYGEEHGVLKTAFVDWWLRTLYLLRVPPRHLRRIHDRWLASGKARRARTQPVPQRRKSLQGRA